MSVETVLITGASSGIGRELARCFAADGARLILLARNRSALQSLADELRSDYKTTSEVFPADLSQPATPGRIFDYFQTHGTKVDILVNNAGFGAYGKFFELPAERQLQMLQLNVTSLMQLTRMFLPGMVSRKRGGVLNVASTAAFLPGPEMALYFATKAFVLSLSEALSEELVGTGVTVTTLCPGPTATNFTAAAGVKSTSMHRRASMSAEQVARIGRDAFRAKRAIVVPGFANKLLTSAVRFAPRVVVRKAAKAFNRATHADESEMR